jgi:integrase
MPSVQRGSVVKSGRGWAVRWYDTEHVRRFQGGFETKSAARAWVDRKADEVLALRRGERPAPTELPTVAALVETFLAAYEADPATIEKMRYQLAHATRAFGETRIDRLNAAELAAWRAELPARSRHHYFRSFRQVLEQAVTWRLLDRNPTERIRNRRVVLDEDREIRPFASWEEVDAIADELGARYRALPAFLVGTGMRPEEALALEWRDVDRKAAVASVDRVHSQGRTKPCKKSDRQRRRVPLRARMLETLDEIPRRLDSPLVFPARDGGNIKLATFRLRHWTSALRAAGIEHRRVYDCRHTFAAWALAAGVQLFYLSRIMGTSVAQIDATYGHLVPDSEDYLRGLLDRFDEVSVAATGAAR